MSSCRGHQLGRVLAWPGAEPFVRFHAKPVEQFAAGLDGLVQVLMGFGHGDALTAEHVHDVQDKDDRRVPRQGLSSCAGRHS